MGLVPAALPGAGQAAPSTGSWGRFAAAEEKLRQDDPSRPPSTGTQPAAVAVGAFAPAPAAPREPLT